MPEEGARQRQIAESLIGKGWRRLEHNRSGELLMLKDDEIRWWKVRDEATGRWEVEAAMQLDSVLRAKKWEEGRYRLPPTINHPLGLFVDAAMMANIRRQLDRPALDRGAEQVAPFDPGIPLCIPIVPAKD